jgi:hypothetical protein
MIRETNHGIGDHPTIETIMSKYAELDGGKASKDQTGLTPT